MKGSGFIISEIGNKYGKLTVIEDTGKRYHQTKVYKCICDCGNYKEVNTNQLHSGHVTSCGCAKSQIKDLTGLRFGRLIVVSFKERSKHKTLWNCKCDCGNDCITSTSCLTTRSTISCGCKNKENKARITIIDKGFVDGTNIHAIKETRKRNKNNSSGHTGVSYDSNRKLWVAQITFQRQNHTLGRFDTIDEAIKARKEAEEYYFGKYRR